MAGRGIRFIAATVRGLLGKYPIVLELTFNALITHIPSHHARQWWLRACGARIGVHTSIFRGTTVLGARGLEIGTGCSIGWRCLLDARGGIVIGNYVVIASDVQLITGSHRLDRGDFKDYYLPVSVNDRVWLATRATLLPGVAMGYAAVAAAGAVVTSGVMPMTIVGGVPAKTIGTRSEVDDYDSTFRPLFH